MCTHLKVCAAMFPRGGVCGAELGGLKVQWWYKHLLRDGGKKSTLQCRHQRERQKGEIENRGGQDGPLDAKKGKKKGKGDDSRGLLTLSFPDHQSVTFLTRLGLGQDVLLVKNRDQYAGHITKRGRGGKWWRQSTVFTAAAPYLPCLTTTMMTLFPRRQFISTVAVSHSGFFNRGFVILAKSQMTATNINVIQIMIVLNIVLNIQ